MSGSSLPRLAAIVIALLSLVAGIAGGLARLGAAPAPVFAITHHAALMISGFLGTVISLERAVALGRGAGYLAPLASAIGALLLMAGWTEPAMAFWIAAPLALLAVSLAIVHRQALPHTALLAIAAALWLAGNAGFAAGASGGVIEAWFGFLVLTIAAERLELTRLLPRRPWAAASFRVTIALLLAAVAASFVEERAGALVFGAALAALGAWLWRFDLARRTLHAHGFARFAAVSLLTGYAWLAAAGVAWVVMALGAGAARDFALHAVALSFVFSMILGHAPIVIPAVARVKLRFHAGFYVPLAVLHASLLARLAVAPFQPAWRAPAGIGNAIAIALFVAMIALSVRKARAASRRGVIMEGSKLSPCRNP